MQFPKVFPWQARIAMEFPDSVTVRCPNLDCTEPCGSIRVLATVGARLNERGYIEEQDDDVHYYDDSLAWCSVCGREGTYLDFKFTDTDFYIFPNRRKE